jgi:hypothetical protein
VNEVQFPACPVFTMSIMVMEAITFHLLFKSLHLFSFFLYSHVRMKEAVCFLVTGFSCLASSRLSSSNTNNAWHFKVEGLSSIALEFVFDPYSHSVKTVGQLIVSLPFPMLGLQLKKWNFPNSPADANSCGGLGYYE